LAIDPANVEALLSAAEADIRRRPPALAKAAARLQGAVREAPVEAWSYSDLGVVALLGGDRARADTMFAIARRLSRRELPAEAYGFASALERADYAAAWAVLNVILRLSPGSLAAALPPVIAQALRQPGALAPLSALMATDPPWRDELLAALAAKPDGLEAVATVLTALRATPHPPTDAEVAGLLRGEIAAKDYGRAIDDWRSLSPAARGAPRSAVYNGRFRTGGSEAPFNWMIASDAAGVVSLAAGADGAGLRAVPTDSSGDAPLVAELMVLAPGSYSLSGQTRIPGAAFPRSAGFAWSMRCADTGQVIGQTGPVSATDRWSGFATAFTAPPGACAGQWLELRRLSSLSEDSSQAPALFDRMTVSVAPR